MESNEGVYPRTSCNQGFIGSEPRRPSHLLGSHRSRSVQPAQDTSQQRIARRRDVNSSSTRVLPPLAPTPNSHRSSLLNSNSVPPNTPSAPLRLPPRSIARSASSGPTISTSQSLGMPPRHPSSRILANPSLGRPPPDATTDPQPIDDPRKSFYASAPKKKTSVIQRLAGGSKYEPRASKSIERAFRKELEANLNHETWIERMILDGDKPPIFYWQSLETKECYEELPFGSYKTVHLDDIVLIRKPKPQFSPDRQAAREESKKATANTKKGNKRREFKSRFGSFIFKSKKILAEV